MKNNIIRIIPSPFYDFIAYVLPGTILFIIISDILYKKKLINCETFNYIKDIDTTYQLVLVGLLILAVYFLGVIISCISPFFYKKIISPLFKKILPCLQYELCEEEISKRKEEIIKCLQNLGYNFLDKKFDKSLVRMICKRFLRQKYEKMADLIVKRDAKIMLIENMTLICVLLFFLYKDLIPWLIILIIIFIPSHVVQIKARANELVSTFLTCASLEIKENQKGISSPQNF